MSPTQELGRPPGSPPLRVLSVGTQFAGLGGVESVLRSHHDTDALEGIDSRFLVFWEDPVPGWPRACFLGFRESLSIRGARRRVAAAFPGWEAEVVVYHTPWGWPYFDDLMPAGRRILYLHSDIPGLDEQLRTRAHWADGFACVNDRIAERVMRARPDLSPDRLLRVLYPIDPPAVLSSPARPRGSPLRLGFCGRLAFEQKRIDRIPDLVRRLDAAGIDHRLEFLGDGPERSWLEAELPDRGRYVFHGRKSGEDYWRILSAWDALLFVSDYEGTPIALLEAMAAGVIPIHPAIGSGGDRYAGDVHPDLAYPAGDLGALTSVIAGLSRWSPEALEAGRRKSIERVRGHASAEYRATFARFLRHIAHQPPLPKRPLPKRPPGMDWLSFRATRHLMEWRRRWKGR
jgi:glycosyltransferase involved in cell wall biosynthesis